MPRNSNLDGLGFAFPLGAVVAPRALKLTEAGHHHFRAARLIVTERTAIETLCGVEYRYGGSWFDSTGHIAISANNGFSEEEIMSFIPGPDEEPAPAPAHSPVQASA